MKRTGNLFDRLVEFDNLYLAFHKALLGKKQRTDCADFAFLQEEELFRLQADLMNKQYRPGGYRTFFVYEKKTRMISAAPFRDRVVHHALCNILEPLFEPGFIFDSYANRKCKGVHAAVKRCSHYAAQFTYVLKCDIRKYFASIDHQILKNLIRCRIKDRDVLWLADRIIDGSNEQEFCLCYFPGDNLFTPLDRRRGLPIGNQTSQFFANVYLNPLDHFVKEDLRCPGYIRYVDDFIVFGRSKKELWEWGKAIKSLLLRYRLIIHPNKFQVMPVRCGFAFLGYRIFPYHRILPKENILRFRRRLEKMKHEYEKGAIDLQTIRLSISGWLGHAIQADSFRVRRKIFSECDLI